MNPSPEEIRQLLAQARVIAMVGASSKPGRDSHQVMRRLLDVGYRVIPVNPNETAVHGRRAYPALRDVPEPIDIIDVFRRSSATPEIADDAVAVGARVLWLQSGVVNEEAARRARAGGLIVIMDACIAVLHSVLGVSPK